MNMVSKNEYWESDTEARHGKYGMKIEFARVVALTAAGEPVLQFSGERLLSQKTYVSLKSYEPEVGDRVMLINDVIQGGWRPRA